MQYPFLLALKAGNILRSRFEKSLAVFVLCFYIFIGEFLALERFCNEESLKSVIPID